jgi:AcrR family transcriptional regulator
MHAQANPGSIYFHWKTKAELVRDVFQRRLAPLDAERVRRLDAAERASAPDPARSRRCSTRWRADARDRERRASFMRLLGRTYNEPTATSCACCARDHGATLERFRAALARALPDLPEEQLFARFHSRWARYAYTLGSEASSHLALGRRRRPVSGREVLRELMPFLVAGLRRRARATPAAARMKRTR